MNLGYLSYESKLIDLNLGLLEAKLVIDMVGIKNAHILSKNVKSMLQNFSTRFQKGVACHEFLMQE